METFVFQSPQALYWLWLLPALAFIFVYGEKACARARRRFAGSARVFAGGAPGRRWVRFFLRAGAAACVVLALARPAWDPRPETRPATGRDVVFLLDVSRSMLADDLAPSRLGRAKLAVQDCVEKIKGDRVALLAFAGSSALLCPLTVDYSFFLSALKEASPESVERGGSLPGDALRKAGELLLGRGSDGAHTDLVMVTDGGDADMADESFAEAAAAELGKKGARLLVVGIGDASQGRRIPETGADGSRRFVQYRGREVWDKLHSGLLRKMAAATPGGVYFNAGTGNFDLGEIYETVISAADKGGLGERTVVRYQEKFPLFLGVALALLALEMFWGAEGKRG